MEHFSSAFYLTILGLACIAAAPLFLFQKHDSVFCSSSLVIARTLDTNYRTGRAKGSIAMRTFFESIEGKIRNELASAIDYRMLSVCFIHLFRNRKIVHKENLIGNLSLPVSRLLSLLEGAIPCGFYETLKAHYAPEFIIFLYGSISLASIYFCFDLRLARDWSSRRWNLFFVLMTLTFILLSLLLKVFDSGLNLFCSV